jgi:hypothetical protein
LVKTHTSSGIATARAKSLSSSAGMVSFSSKTSRGRPCGACANCSSVHIGYCKCKARVSRGGLSFFRGLYPRTHLRASLVRFLTAVARGGRALCLVKRQEPTIAKRIWKEEYSCSCWRMYLYRSSRVVVECTGTDTALNARHAMQCKKLKSMLLIHCMLRLLPVDHPVNSISYILQHVARLITLNSKRCRLTLDPTRFIMYR